MKHPISIRWFIAVLFALMLLLVQVLAATHMARHAFCHHSHHGQECDITLFAEKVAMTAPPALLAACVLLILFYTHRAVIQLSGTRCVCVRFHPRAPPA